MDKSVQRILRSIVQQHGLHFISCQHLCNAYLADLIPQFPEERRQLVAAVAYGLPDQLLRQTTRPERKELALKFAQNSSFSNTQALSIVETWFYALQDFSAQNAAFKASSTKQRKLYLSAAVASSVVLLVGSAIAFYKLPSTTAINPAIIPTTQALNTQEVVAKKAVTRDQTVHEAKVNSPKAALQATSYTKTQAPQPVQLAELPFLRPLALSDMNQPTLLDFNSDLASASIKHELIKQTTEAKVMSSVESHPAKQKETSLSTIATQTALSKTSPIAPLESTQTKAAHQVEQKKNRPASAEEASQASEAKQSKVAAKHSTSATKTAFSHSLQDLQALSAQILRLAKKQADQKAVAQLLELTGDPFYREQLADLKQQQLQLHQTIDRLSESYAKQVAKLCAINPSDAQNKELFTGKRSTQLEQTVVKHWQSCRALSSQAIKQELLSSYRIAP